MSRTRDCVMPDVTLINGPPNRDTGRYITCDECDVTWGYDASGERGGEEDLHHEGWQLAAAEDEEDYCPDCVVARKKA